MSSFANELGGLTANQATALNSFLALGDTVAGYHLAKSGNSFVVTADTGGGGGGSPGGATTQLQYNNAGAFGGITGATTDGTKLIVTSTGFEIADITTSTKKAVFNVASISAATTRTLTVQNSDGTLALLSNNLGQFGSTTSAQLASVLSDKTGTGVNVFATSPTLVTPILGTPTSVTLTNGTGLPISTGVSGLGAGVATFLATPSSANLSSALSDKTGTGVNVFATSPTLVTPTLGVALATSVNGLTISTTTGTLTLTNAKTLAVTNSLTFSGTDATVMTFPTTSATIARTDAAQTFTGVQTFVAPVLGTPTTLVGTNITGTATGFTAGKARQLVDTNGLAAISVGTTASAVNQVTVTNAVTAGAPVISATGTDTNIDLQISAKGTGAIKHVDATFQDIVSTTDGATITFDMSLGNLQSVTMGGNRTLALSNVKVGQVFMLRLSQDGTGTRVPTWFTTIKWAGGVAPTLTTTASKTDVLGFICTSAGNYDGFVVGLNI